LARGRVCATAIAEYTSLQLDDFIFVVPHLKLLSRRIQGIFGFEHDFGNMQSTIGDAAQYKKKDDDQHGAYIIRHVVSSAS
jgi:hypothetical protein